MSNYRARLIDVGLIESVGHGLVGFAIPGWASTCVEYFGRRIDATGCPSPW
ncbi:hypothetical protein [Arthrobacter sp. Marseille-P9274]|uniref:hypothetical protein n=1 Tax=Arthrobacter sp. Marseille-P9274 TaxID=2866572 RepID=UPI0021C80DC4|nr:hypothetical protein [Arthrobacter sp. Marseille-P9274]